MSVDFFARGLAAKARRNAGSTGLVVITPDKTGDYSAIKADSGKVIRFNASTGDKVYTVSKLLGNSATEMFTSYLERSLDDATSNLIVIHDENGAFVDQISAPNSGKKAARLVVKADGDNVYTEGTSS